MFPLFLCKCHSWCCCCLRLTLAYLGYQATLGTEKVTLRCFHFHWQQHFPHNTAASDKSGYMLLRGTPVTSTTITTSSKFSHATFNTHLGTKRYALNSFNTKATTTWTRRTSLALSHRHASSLHQAHAQIPALFSTEMTHTLLSFSDIFRGGYFKELMPSAGKKPLHRRWHPVGSWPQWNRQCPYLASQGTFSRSDTKCSFCRSECFDQSCTAWYWP